jgi:hypothetical protein
MLNGSLQTTVVCIVHALPAMNLLYVSFGRLTSRTYRIHNVNSVLPDWRGWTPSLPLAHGLGDQLLVTGVEILSCVRSTVLTASHVLVLGEFKCLSASDESRAIAGPIFSSMAHRESTIITEARDPAPRIQGLTGGSSRDISAPECLESRPTVRNEERSKR